MDVRSALSAPKSACPTISMVDRYICRHCQRDITLAELAKVAHMNRNYLSERFKAEIGLGIGDYIALCRVECAKALLRASKDKIVSVGRSSGFRSEVTFYRCFSRLTGMTPGEYRSACKQPGEAEFKPLAKG